MHYYKMIEENRATWILERNIKYFDNGKQKQNGLYFFRPNRTVQP